MNDAALWENKENCIGPAAARERSCTRESRRDPLVLADVCCVAAALRLPGSVILYLSLAVERSEKSRMNFKSNEKKKIHYKGFYTSD
jgi:hypothetical protein